jgi:hypothetical protein
VTERAGGAYAFVQGLRGCRGGAAGRWHQRQR